jgi:hypothetical protein
MLNYGVFLLVTYFAYLKYASACINPTFKDARFHGNSNDPRGPEKREVNFLMIDLTGVPCMDSPHS